MRLVFEERIPGAVFKQRRPIFWITPLRDLDRVRITHGRHDGAIACMSPKEGCETEFVSLVTLLIRDEVIAPIGPESCEVIGDLIRRIGIPRIQISEAVARAAREVAIEMAAEN